MTADRSQRLIVPEHDALRGLLSGDHDGTGGISDVEIEHLCWCAAQVPPGGDVVEIGSHRGKSTCALGCGLRHAGNASAKIYAVDLWLKGSGRTFDHYSSVETWELFNAQVAELGLTGVVQPRMMSSAAAAARRRRPIWLLFIDASHKYEHVLQDFGLWHGFVPSGGRIVFHDYGTRFKGVDRVVEERVISSGRWAGFAVHHRLFSAVRV